MSEPTKQKQGGAALPDSAADADRQDAVNAIGAAGESADPFVDTVVSGMPAGGSDTLETKNAETDDDYGEDQAHPS